MRGVLAQARGGGGKNIVVRWCGGACESHDATHDRTTADRRPDRRGSTVTKLAYPEQRLRTSHTLSMKWVLS